MPIVLGMVLDGIMEMNLRLALPRFNTAMDMVDRPIAAILFGMVFLVSVFHLRKLIKELRHPPEGDYDLHYSQMR